MDTISIKYEVFMILAMDRNERNNKGLLFRNSEDNYISDEMYLTS